MARQEDLDLAYLGCAKSISGLSRARRKQVGAILVGKNGGIVAEGFNGTYSGCDNNCEIEIAENGITKLITKPEVVHAESNAILKVARSTNSSEGSTMYCTLSCCVPCAIQMIQAGIVRFVYIEDYKTDSGESRQEGLVELQKAGVRVIKISI